MWAPKLVHHALINPKKEAEGEFVVEEGSVSHSPLAASNNNNNNKGSCCIPAPLPDEYTIHQTNSSQ